MNNLTLTKVLTALGVALCLQATAQNGYNCGLDEHLAKLRTENPHLETDRQQLMNQFRSTEGNKGGKRDVLTIPIVFHIIHQYGDENISDAQIYDQMRILNEDYRMKNADTASVVPAFDTVRADAMIRFSLATIDPYGNPTNGIEHIYSHETNHADDFSKINQWDRSRYLNVWVVRSFEQAGVAGYAYFPESVESDLAYTDGVILINYVIGSIGTSTPGSSRTLTHEIGHYLGLNHLWAINPDPVTTCGDDGILDTPVTKRYLSGNCILNANECNPGIIENVQNFMESSYCARMFTRDQVAFMHYVLNQPASGRNNLSTAENLHNTGADQDPAPLAPPVADFYISQKNSCIGEQVTYKNASWGGTAASYSWSFPGGNPATSTDPNPVVTYATDGQYSATLTVTNTSGTSTKTFSNIIYVSPDWVENVGPDYETFNGVSYWFAQNPEANYASFQLVHGAGKDKSNCYELKNYRDISGADPYSPDSFYYDRLGGSTDYLISESYDLTTTTGVLISFDYAYGSSTTTAPLFPEKLNIYASKNCGVQWNLLTTLDANELLTVGYTGNIDFVPASNNQWKTKSFAYNVNSVNPDAKTRFRFEFIASDQSNNLFIDNFNVSGQLGITDNAPLTAVSMSPNPVASGTDLSVQVELTDTDMELELMDMNGAVISTTSVSASNGTQTVKIPMNVAKGCYMIQAMKGASKSTHRVIVF